LNGRIYLDDQAEDLDGGHIIRPDSLASMETAYARCSGAGIQTGHLLISAQLLSIDLGWGSMRTDPKARSTPDACRLLLMLLSLLTVTRSYLREVCIIFTSISQWKPRSSSVKNPCPAHNLGPDTRSMMRSPSGQKPARSTQRVRSESQEDDELALAMRASTLEVSDVRLK